MTDTYSTMNRDTGSGRVYSSRSGPVTILPTAGSGRLPAATMPGPTVPAAALRTPQPVEVGPALEFPLSGQGLPMAGMAGGAITGSVSVGRGGSVTGTLTGMPGLVDPSLRVVLWLLHDLMIPTDLSPADLAALPKGAQGTGNQPGTIFTLDGNPPTYGVNTVPVSITTGEFKPSGERSWQLTGAITPVTNRAFHPLVALGPTALPDINAGMATGSVIRILTDLFLRPAAVHPSLDVRTQYPARLARIVQEAAGQPEEFLPPSAFTRAAVTLEGPVRPTSWLMPTRQTCVAIGAAQPVG